jgi:type II secretory pathway component PulF
VKRSDIMLVTSNLADFLDAGMSMSEAVDRLEMAVPKYKSLWQQGGTAIRNGYPLSSVLVEEWPESLVAVVIAGEDSGNVAGIFRDIEEALKIEQEVIKTSMTVVYPLAMIFAGLGVGLFFMLTVLPNVAKNMRGASSTVLDLSLAMSAFFEAYTQQILIAVVGGLIGAAYAVMQPGVRNSFMGIALSVPKLSAALIDLRFGIWAKYLSLCTATGISTAEALRITQPVLPPILQQVVIKIREDLANNVSLSETVNIQNMEANDPRRKLLPFFVGNAFAIAAQTGRLDTALAKSSPTLIRQGTHKLKRIVEVGKLLGIGFAAASIISPLGVVYSELFRAMQELQ